MKNLPQLLIGLLVATVMLAFAVNTVTAQEKAKAEKAKTAQETKSKVPPPNPVLFENEKMRVTEGRIKPGEKNEMKARGERLNIAINDAKTRVHYSDGKKEDRERKAGNVRFNKAATSSTENIGKTETRSVIVTLK